MMQRFRKDPSHGSLGLFGPVDVGKGVYWWDYGQLKLYQRSTLLMAEASEEASLIRSFFGIPEAGRVLYSEVGSACTVDQHSTASSCVLGSGSVKNSVLSNINCQFIEAEGCVLINVTAKRISAKPGCIIYNVIDSSEEGLIVENEDVLAGVSSPDGSQLVMRSNMSIDGGKAWETRVAGNPLSFEEVYNSNTGVCPITIEKTNSQAHREAWSSFSR